MMWCMILCHKCTRSNSDLLSAGNVLDLTATFCLLPSCECTRSIIDLLSATILRVFGSSVTPIGTPILKILSDLKSRSQEHENELLHTTIFHKLYCQGDFKVMVSLMHA